jgi:hypothetical protein
VTTPHVAAPFPGQGASIYDGRVGALRDVLRDENRSEHLIVTTHPITDADRIRCDLTTCQRKSLGPYSIVLPSSMTNLIRPVTNLVPPTVDMA